MHGKTQHHRIIAHKAAACFYALIIATTAAGAPQVTNTPPATPQTQPATTKASTTQTTLKKYWKLINPDEQNTQSGNLHTSNQINPITLQDLKGKDCLSSGCHQPLVDQPWIHSPVVLEACSTCHESTGQEVDHTYKLVRPKETLCTFCHRAPKPQQFAHKAYVESDCTSCHDPHAGATPALLITQNEASLCSTCHIPQNISNTVNEIIATTNPLSTPATSASPPTTLDTLNTLTSHTPLTLHQPIADGQCMSCHSPHQSEFPALLPAPLNDTCLACHDKLQEALASAKHIHDPVTSSNCSDCHRSHASDHQSLLTQAPKQLCLSCHNKEEQIIAHKDDIHGSVNDPNSCITCHKGHTGESKALVQTPIVDACFSCHNEEIESTTGQIIPNMMAQITNAKFKHGPITEGKCQPCHLSHTSEHQSLLTSDLPDTTYAKFNAKTYDLCFQCHESSLATEEFTIETNFRDGERNLHFVHVNRDKGRTCSLCHDTHASDSPKFVREKVPYGSGGWELEINFVQNEQGGTCSISCHKELSYNINTPLNMLIKENTPNPPTPPPAPTP